MRTLVPHVGQVNSWEPIAIVTNVDQDVLLVLVSHQLKTTIAKFARLTGHCIRIDAFLTVIMASIVTQATGTIAMIVLLT